MTIFLHIQSLFWTLQLSRLGNIFSLPNILRCDVGHKPPARPIRLIFPRERQAPAWPRVARHAKASCRARARRAQKPLPSQRFTALGLSLSKQRRMGCLLWNGREQCQYG